MSRPDPTTQNLKALLQLAARHLQRGATAEAERACIAALRHAPGDAEALHMHALVAHRQGDLAAARARLERAVAAGPKIARFHNSLGVILRESGAPERARRSLERALKLRPRFPGARYNLGLALEDLGLHEEALGAFERACRLDPEMAPAHHARGLALQALGRLEDARDAYRRAIGLDPAYAEAHFHLAHARRATAGEDEQLDAIENLLANGRPTPRECAWLESARGKLNDDLGRYDRAFEAYRAANQLAAGPYDPDSRDGLVSRLAEAFSVERLLRGSPAALVRSDRVFVVGMPRSGTTLLEAMISAHPDVEAGGERKEIARALADASNAGGTADPREWAMADDAALRVLAGSLDSHLAAATGSRFLVDKLPGNVWHLGVIGLLLPRAPVLLAWRDPRDIGLSCYFTRFEEGHDYSNDLYHCGRQIRATKRLMDHWLKALPNPVMMVSYEQLVSEPDATMEQVLDCCRLPALETSNNHRTAPGAVTTASSWQVRQGLYRSSVGRWRHYHSHIAPLLEGLGDVAPDS